MSETISHCRSSILRIYTEPYVPDQSELAAAANPLRSCQACVACVDAAPSVEELAVAQVVNRTSHEQSG